MLTSKQRAILRGKANTMDPVFIVGKGEIDETMIQGVKDCLDARELIKLKVLESSMYNAREASVKLAEATVVGELFGEHPVLLLDDVLSELDDERQTYLLTRMGEHQTIVTTCDTAAFARTNGKIVMVKGGTVAEP